MSVCWNFKDSLKQEYYWQLCIEIKNDVDISLKCKV